MEGLYIRPATADDKQDILNIADVYYGVDYLKDFFDEVFIHCRHSTPYVAVYKGNIIGFVAAFTVDGGATVITRAARVSREHLGLGVYTMITHHMLERSNATVKAFTMVNTMMPTSDTFQEENKLILTRPWTRYMFSATDLKFSNDEALSTSSLATVTRDCLQHYFTSHSLKRYLFPEDRIVANWVPFKLLTSNIPIIFLREKESLRLSDVRVKTESCETVLSGNLGTTKAHDDIGRVIKTINAHSKDEGEIGNTSEDNVGISNKPRCDDAQCSGSKADDVKVVKQYDDVNLEDDLKCVNLEDDGVKDAAHEDVEGLLSISTGYTSPEGLYVYQLDLYGSDDDSVTSHITSHLRFVATKATGEATIVIVSDPRLDAAGLHAVVQEYGFEKMTFSAEYTSQCLFENVINTNKNAAN